MKRSVRAYYQHFPSVRPSAKSFWSPAEFEHQQSDGAGSETHGHGLSLPQWQQPGLHPYAPHTPFPPYDGNLQPARHSAPIRQYRVDVNRSALSPAPATTHGSRLNVPRAPENEGMGVYSPGSTESVGDTVGRYRDTHVMSEQKRRNNIKDGFDGLQALVPGCPTNATKADILKLAKDFITQLQATGQIGLDLKEQLKAADTLADSLKRENATLVQDKVTLLLQVEQLRKEKEELLQRFGVSAQGSHTAGSASSCPENPGEVSHFFGIGNFNHLRGQRGGNSRAESWSPPREGGSKGGKHCKAMIRGSHYYHELSPVSTGALDD